MGILIGNHGKLGSGKNETSTQLRILCIGKIIFEEKALAYYVKLLTAIMTKTSMEIQYTREGKNLLIPLYDKIKNKILFDIDNLKIEMKKYKSFAMYDIEKGYIKINNEDVDDVILKTIHVAFTRIYDLKSVPISNNSDNIFKLTIGEIQQEIGTQFRLLYGENIWVDLLFEEWTEECNWIITDVRFPNEKKAIKDRGGLCIKLIGDPMNIKENSKRDLNHISETALDDDNEWDFIIDNKINDINNLINQLVQFIEKYENLFNLEKN